MADRASVIRPPQGPVLAQGWLHPEIVSSMIALFDGRPTTVALPGYQDAMYFKGWNQAGWVQRLFSCLFSRNARCVGASYSSVGVGPGDPSCLSEAHYSMIWSPLWVQSVAFPQAVFEHWFHWLKLQGVVFFSTLGPDSASVLAQVAKELKLDFPDFADMHDVGDQLVGVGFSDPVMEMEKLTLTYRDALSLLLEWHALMGDNLVGRSKGLRGRAFRGNVLSQLERCRSSRDERLHLDLEIVYGHAWKVRPKTPAGQAVVPLSELGGRAKK